MSDSLLQIGPSVTLTHHVQSINIDENRNVYAPSMMRSRNSAVIEKGASKQSAKVQLLFTGEELRYELPLLLATFRVSPITSVYNEMLASTWPPRLDVDLSKSFNYVPVALTSLRIRTVPDVPQTVLVMLEMIRIDISPVSVNNENVLKYVDSAGNPVINPKYAKPLQDWIKRVAYDYNSITPNNLGNILVKWKGMNIEGNYLPGQPKDNVYITTEDQDVKALAETVGIDNYFGFQFFQGKPAPFPQYMGTSRRHYSLDVSLYTDPDKDASDTALSKLSKLKERADKVIRSTTVIERLTGLEIQSELLSALDNPLFDEGSTSVMVPLFNRLTTTETPNLKQFRSDMMESTISDLHYYQTKISDGGYDLDDLKFYFKSLISEDYKYRVYRTGTGKEFTPGTLANQKAHTTVWPYSFRNGTRTQLFQNKFGIINTDSLKAAIIDFRKDDYIDTLKESIYHVQKISTGTTEPTLVEKARTGFEVLREELDVQEESPLFRKLQQITYEIIKDQLFSYEVEGDIPPDEELRAMATAFTYEFYHGYKHVADFHRKDAAILRKIATGKYRLSYDFTDKIFKVVTQRKKPPYVLGDIYDLDGLEAAFSKLTIDFDINVTTKHIKKREEAEQRKLERGYAPIDPINALRYYTYPDIPMPSFSKAFGDNWKLFAENFDDVGEINPNIADDTDFEDGQKELINAENDIIHPATYFYNRRSKDITEEGEDPKNIKSISEKISDGMDALTISIPFNTDDLEDIRSILASRGERPLTKEQQETVSGKIRAAMYAAKGSATLGDAFRDDMRNLQLRSADEEFKSRINDLDIHLYVVHTGNHIAKNRVTIPGMGGEILKVASKDSFYPVSDALYIKSDEAMLSSDPSEDPEFRFIKHLEENTQGTLKRSMDQVTDVAWSTKRMFPTFKVYLVDYRGNEVVLNDVYFDTSAIISIDITNDKEDAGTAIIKLADPLRFLQNAMLLKDNIVTYEKGEDFSGRKALGSLQGAQVDEYLDRYLIAQGRGVVIKMGYSADSRYLKTIFTGRIQEILPGDEIALVCQGWKIELHNRQVSFYNEDPNNWGARDLAIQAVTAADPQGMGHMISQNTIDYITTSLRSLDPASLAAFKAYLGNSIANMQGVTTENPGVFDDFSSYLRRRVNLASITRQDRGIDTRLRNIWYPDAADPAVGNLLGWRTYSYSMPSYTNDSWSVPLKPSWDVLKEAERHAWNCIVQVVPYDARSTIFMGHPDQPYYYTQGTVEQTKKWKTYVNSRLDKGYDILEEAKEKFIGSDLYNKSPHYSLIRSAIFEIAKKNLSVTTDPYLQLPAVSYVLRDGVSAVPSSYLTIRSLVADKEKEHKYAQHVGTTTVVTNFINIKAFADALLNSALPLQKFNQVESMYGELLAPVIFSLYADLNPKYTHTAWSTIKQDIKGILASKADGNPLEAVLRDRVPVIDNIYEVANNIGVVRNSRYGLRGYRNVLEQITRPISKDFLQIIKEAPIGNTNEQVRLRQELLRVLQRLEVDQRYYDLINASNSRLRYIKQTGRLYLTREESRLLPNPRPETRNSLYLSAAEQDEILAIEQEVNTLLIEYSAALREKPEGPKDILNARKLLIDFKAFVYFFCESILNDTETMTKIGENKKALAVPTLPYNMKIFRDYHYIDNEINLIQNNIVASTREMWNTVVIEHPGRNELDSILDEGDEVFGNQKILSSVQWNYWPKSQITGVYGLQFHPGLTLQNKKIKKCTELNAYSDELLAKLACNHLAYGIQKMYRGTIMCSGTAIKAHDILLLRDDYTKMYGPVDVETVIHHYSPDIGWVTHVTPNAVCKANPGAEILKTAALEVQYKKIFAVTDLITDALTFAAIVSTLGTAAPGAAAANQIVKN